MDALGQINFLIEVALLTKAPINKPFDGYDQHRPRHTQTPVWGIAAGKEVHEAKAVPRFKRTLAPPGRDERPP